MNGWLRRIRGAVGMGITWAVAWALAGVLIGVLWTLGLPMEWFIEVFDAPLPALAVPGFFGGAVFSTVLGIAGRRRRFDELSLPRFGALGAVARHFQRLHLVCGRTARGETLDGSVKGLRPPVFWKRADRFKAQATTWPPAALARALERLLEAEAACKQSGAVPETICARTLLKIAVNAPRRRQRRSG